VRAPCSLRRKRAGSPPHSSLPQPPSCQGALLLRNASASQAQGRRDRAVVAGRGRGVAGERGRRCVEQREPHVAVGEGKHRPNPREVSLREWSARRSRRDHSDVPCARPPPVSRHFPASAAARDSNGHMTQFASGEAKPASPEANRAHERTAGQPPQNAYSAPEGGSWARWGYWTA
jgi:hypothetical protein